MSNAIDHVSDFNGVEMHRLNQLYDFPDFVKNASIDSVRPAENAPSTVFADHISKNWPCHTPASTWLSTLYFVDKQADYNSKKASVIKQRLDKFASYWNIKDATDAIYRTYDKLHKQADEDIPDEDFAFVWKGADGSTERRCRMTNAAEVKTAADWLYKYSGDLTWTDKNTIASKIITKAGKYGTDLGDKLDFIEKHAGMGVCDPKKVATLLQNRAKLAKTAESREEMTKLAEVVKDKPAAALIPAQLIKLAETVDIFDRANQIHGKYSEAIPAPEDVIFNVTYSQVKESTDGAFSMQSGNLYRRDELTKLSEADLRAMFGDDFAEQCQSGLDIDPEKTAELAATLPANDAHLFEELLNEAGIAPVIKQAAGRSGVSEEDLQHYASQA